MLLSEAATVFPDVRCVKERGSFRLVHVRLARVILLAAAFPAFAGMG
jgi:hypothetical protein